MAKNEFGYDEKEDQLDKELREMEIDFGDNAKAPAANSREAVTRSIAKFGKGFKGSFTEDKTKTIKDMVKASLPDELASEFGGIADIATSLKDEFSLVGKKLKSSSRGILNTINKYAPKDSALESFSAKLKELVAEDYDSGVDKEKEAAAARNKVVLESITALLGKKVSSDEQRELLQQAVEQKRSQTLQELGMITATNVEHTNRFHHSITNSYYRKSLELQYQSLFIQKQQLEIYKSSFDNQKLQFETIIHNTGLPDIIKSSTGENFKFITKRQIATKLSDQLFASKTWQESIKGRLIGTVKGLGARLAGGLSGAGELAGMAEDASDLVAMGGGVETIGGETIGDVVKSQVGKAVGKRYAKTEKGRARIMNLKEIMIDPSEFFKEVGESRKGFGSKIAQFASRLTKQEITESKLFVAADDLTSPRQFDGRVYSSITKVIPTILTKIYSEIKASRTGGKPETVRYDFAADKFVGEKETARAVRRDVKKKLVSTGVKGNIDSIVSLFINDASEEFDPQEISTLKRGILAYTISGKPLNPSTLVKNGFLNFFTGKVKDKVLGSLNNIIGKGSPEAKFDKIQSMYDSLNRTRRDAPSPSKLVEQFSKAGNIDVLDKIGITMYDEETGTRQVDAKKYQKLIGDLLTDTASDKGMATRPETITENKTVMQQPKPKLILDASKGLTPANNFLEHTAVSNGTNGISTPFDTYVQGAKDTDSKLNINTLKYKQRASELKNDTIGKLNDLKDSVSLKPEISQKLSDGLNKLRSIDVNSYKQDTLEKIHSIKDSAFKAIDDNINIEEAANKARETFSSVKDKVTPENIAFKKRTQDLKQDAIEKIKDLADKININPDIARKLSEQIEKLRNIDINSLKEDAVDKIQELKNQAFKAIDENIDLEEIREKGLIKSLLKGGLGLAGKGIKGYFGAGIKGGKALNKLLTGSGPKSLLTSSLFDLPGTIKDRFTGKGYYSKEAKDERKAKRGSLLGKGIDYIKQGAGIASKGAKGVAGTTVDTGILLNKIVTGDKERTTMNKNILELLKKKEEPAKKKNIFDTDSSGFREGSWRDRLKKKPKEGEEEKDTTKAPVEKSGGKGLLGMLGMLVAPILGIFNTIRKIGSSIFKIPKLLGGMAGLLGKLPMMLGGILGKGAGVIKSAWDMGKGLVGKAGVKLGGAAMATTAATSLAGGAATATSAATKGAAAATKLAPKPKTGAIKTMLKSFKDKIFKKFGAVGGKKIAGKLTGKILARAVPFAGQALLAYDAVMIGKRMLFDKDTLGSAVSKQILGFDLFGDDLPTDEDGNPIKPDEPGDAPTPTEEGKANIDKALIPPETIRKDNTAKVAELNKLKTVADGKTEADKVIAAKTALTSSGQDSLISVTRKVAEISTENLQVLRSMDGKLGASLDVQRSMLKELSMLNANMGNISKGENKTPVTTNKILESGQKEHPAPTIDISRKQYN